jgi:tRNA U34 5-carboxymethylaminomethyl modifying GTPase MnmE/TrmE
MIPSPDDTDFTMENVNGTGTPAGATNSNDWNPATLAHELFELRQRIERGATQLAGALALDLDDIIADARQLLDNQVCTIAVVGQIKSGKSTFINAWLRRPNLLPTSVNPWTTSVTHLRLGQRGPDGIAARFTFFGRDEWSTIANDGGPIRELTERFVSGFERELLQHHLDSMKRRSQARLGAELDSLLGTHHDYPTLTHNILDKYVCAGPLEPDHDEIEIGKYSDITRRADIFVEVTPPAFPVTIIDTPGTNDPFMVRDEITRRALAEADVHIVVMTARQALSSQDLSLLQILHGLNKTEIVVFISRIDELPDPARDVAEVGKRLQITVGRLCPGLKAAIVFGSARWAEIALNNQGATPHDSIDNKLTRYAATTHASTPALIDTDGNGGAPDLMSAHDIHAACSGLPELERALRRTIARSRPARILVQTIATLAELCELNRNALEREIAANDRVAKMSAAALHVAADEVARIQAEARRVQELTNVVQTVLMDLNARGRQLVEDQASTIGTALLDHVDQCATVVGAAFRNDTLGAGGGRLQVDTRVLRSQLRDVFESQFRTATQALDELEYLVVPQLVELLVSNTPGSRASDYPLPPTGHIEPPAMTALWQPVSLDLGEPWWRRWWTLTLDKAARQNRLEALVRADFQPIAEALETEALACLRDRQTRILNNATSVFVALAEQLRRHSEAHLEEARRLSAEHRNAASGVPESERGARRDALFHKLDETNRALAGLAALTRQWTNRQAPMAADEDV